jgi:hypothetical protein
LKSKKCKNRITSLNIFNGFQFFKTNSCRILKSILFTEYNKQEKRLKENFNFIEYFLSLSSSSRLYIVLIAHQSHEIIRQNGLNDRDAIFRSIFLKYALCEKCAKRQELKWRKKSIPKKNKSEKGKFPLKIVKFVLYKYK